MSQTTIRGNRVRVPAPLLKRRLPSGRGATEQPNVTSDEHAALTPLFWLLVLATGVAAGLLGDAMMLLLTTVEHLAFGYHSGSLEHAVERASVPRRAASLLAGGAFGGVAWYVLRVRTPGEHSDVDASVWSRDGALSPRRSLGTAVISEVVIGTGASLGREAAPRLLGGLAGSMLGGWARLSPAQRRLLIACGAGAGLAAVYNVPLGGTLYIAEVLWGSVSVPVLLPALTCCWVATLTAWAYLPDHATYTGLPDYRLSVSVVVWALLAGPVIGLAAAAYIRLMGWVSHHKVSGRWSIVAVPAACGVLAVIGIWYPQLFGNGKGMARDAFAGAAGMGLLFILFALKPLVTSLFLGSGASGGLFTPTLSTGAVLGGALGMAWSLLWPGSPPGAFAFVGAAAMMGAAMQAPMAGLALMIELAGTGFSLIVPMAAATATATAVAYYIDGYSIYSARLPTLTSSPAIVPAHPHRAPKLREPRSLCCAKTLRGV